MSYPYGQPGYPPPAYQPPPQPPARQRRWPFAVGGVVVGLVIGGALGNRDDEPPVRSQASPASAVAPAVQAAASEVPAEPAAPSGPLSTFGEGIWEIGVDIVPGKYKTAGVEDGGFTCYAATKKENNGELGDIGKQNLSDGPITIVLAESDGYFDTKGCQNWVLQS